MNSQKTKISTTLLFLFSLVTVNSLYAQIITFKSIEDSTNLRVSVFAYQEGNKIIELHDKNGAIDFTTIPVDATVEVLSEGFEDRTFIRPTTLPSVIYLTRRAKRIDEMVVTGQMQQTSLSDAVQNVRIINAKKIEQMGAQNLTQLFKNELNIQLSQDPVLGAGMSLQGISGENVKILIDGVPIIGRLNGTVDLDQINIQNIAKIEIIEGPLSVNYGSDALAGTINIITKTNQTSTLGGKAYAYYESNGTYNTQLNLSSKFKNTLITGDVNRNYFDGWRPDEKPFHVEKVRVADEFRHKLYKPREQIFGGIKVRQRLNSEKNAEALYLSADVRVFQEEIFNRGIPVAPYQIKAFDDYYFTTRLDNSLSIVGRLSKKWSINSTNAYNYFQRKKNTYLNDLTTLNQVVAGANEQDTSVFDLFLSRTSFIYNHSAKWMFEMGYDINFESSRGKRIENQVSSMGDYALYLTSEYRPIKKLTIKPGVRVAYNSVYKAPVVPSIFFKYRLTKNNDIRFSYSRGYRAPSLKELYFYFVDINHNIVGNKDLRAEHSNNFQLSLRTEYEKGKCRFILTNQLFYNDLYNLISLAQVTNTEYSYVNLAKAKTYGYTINMNFIRKGLSFDAGMTLRGRQTQVVDGGDLRAATIYPEIKINPSYTFNKNNSTIAIFYKYTGKLPNFMLQNDGSIIETRRDDFHMLDATFSNWFWKRKIGVTIGVKNILDVTSINGMTSGDAHSSGSSSVQIGMGRTYFCSLTLNLNTKTK